MNLYELTGQLLALQEMMADPNIDSQILVDTMESLDGDLETKLEGYGKIIRNFESSIAKIDEEIDRLKARKKTYENKVKFLKGNVKNSMEVLERSSVRTPFFLFTVKRGTESAVIDNEKKVPKEFRIKIPDKIDKAAIKKHLKENGPLPYTHLERGDSTLQIK